MGDNVIQEEKNCIVNMEVLPETELCCSGVIWENFSRVGNPLE
jgi:hypothetical protein